MSTSDVSNQLSALNLLKSKTIVCNPLEPASGSVEPAGKRGIGQQPMKCQTTKM